ncbi:hypothetical protein ACFLTP_03535 [Chloroflexota bacterium]
MKKIGILVIALVLAIGSLGVGYAGWTDNIFIEGNVTSGDVCIDFEDVTYAEITPCPEDGDLNWWGWVEEVGALSCPQGDRIGWGFTFEDIVCAPEYKDVATVSFVALDEDGIVVPYGSGAAPIKTLEVTIDNAYPHYLAHLTVEINNCGTIPVKLQPAVWEQDPSLLMEFRDDPDGVQLEPGGEEEYSFFVGVTQYINNDPSQGLTPQDTPLTFRIDFNAIQWNEWEPQGPQG